MLRRLMTATAAALALGGPAAASDELLAMAWDDIVAQAKAEGSVAWFNWYLEAEFREVVKEFEALHGISVTIPDVNSGDDVLNRLLAETGRDATDIDLISMGGSTGLRIVPSELFMGPILPVLPEAAELNTVVEGADWGGYGVQFWGNQTCLAYDPDRVAEEELPDTIEELAAWMEANPGQFGFNFENGGSGPSLIQNVARNVLGITMDTTLEAVPDLQPVYDWFIAQEDNYVLTASNADSLTRFNGGEFKMIATWEDFLGANIKRGEVAERFRCYVPDFGLNGGGNVMAIPKNASNPAAALVLAAWLASAETQTMFNRDFGTAPANARADSTYALIPAEDRANATLWGAPLASSEVVPGVIENVFQR